MYCWKSNKIPYTHEHNIHNPATWPTVHILCGIPARKINLSNSSFHQIFIEVYFSKTRNLIIILCDISGVCLWTFNTCYIKRLGEDQHIGYAYCPVLFNSLIEYVSFKNKTISWKWDTEKKKQIKLSTIALMTDCSGIFHPVLSFKLNTVITISMGRRNSCNVLLHSSIKIIYIYIYRY